MVTAHVLGFPRIGAKRELKFALEAYWQGKQPLEELLRTGRKIRKRHWDLQKNSGLDYITAGDFAWYDHIHNMTALFSAVPQRFAIDTPVDLPAYFDMARGTTQQPALAMKKWFDTNYHYLVPELGPETRFALNDNWLLPQVNEAAETGHPIKVVLPSPLTYLWLASSAGKAFDKLELLPALLKCYGALLQKLKDCKAAVLQIDEPILAFDLPTAWLAAFRSTYRELAPQSPPILLATYFDSIAEHAALLKDLPLKGVHLDLVRAPDQLHAFLPDWPQDKVLSLGVIDGRNLWRTDLQRALTTLRQAHSVLQDRLWLSASCSLLHVPTDLRLETQLDAELRTWMAFAIQKLDELGILKCALNEGAAAVARELNASSEAVRSRKQSPRCYRADVRARAEALSPDHQRRSSPFAQRRIKQRQVLNLPELPTTTIGSFPQTASIRAARAAYRQGKSGEAEYRQAMHVAIRQAVEKQEGLGLDVLVHGEAERNDMVEYFGEQLDGFAFTENGWVQSYGSRCVKPPVIYGDVARPSPMTVAWAEYAQSLTRKPMKGMLTGPVTMLCWSFVRDDLPRRDVAMQIAMALRAEVRDLESAGIRIVQIDEPALREGLPLKQADWQAYLEWAVGAFRICSSGVSDATQIHTHMCYCEFSDILPSIAAMDADVITIETSRSRMQLLDAFAEFQYPNDIGPGVYDIHSARVPTRDEITALLQRAKQVLPAEQLWVNPDCGLKTRGWEETETALSNMVAVAKALRR